MNRARREQAAYTAAVIRRLLHLLLCVGLLLQAPALRAWERAPCPMEATMAAMSVDGAADVEADDLPDCCNDAVTQAATGQPCKAGLDCGLQVAIAGGVAVSSPVVPVAAQRPWPGQATPMPAPCATPWRPPTAV